MSCCSDGVVILPPRYPVIKLFMLDFLFRLFRMRAGPSLFVDYCNCANLLSLRQTIWCITVIHWNANECRCLRRFVSVNSHYIELITYPTVVGAMNLSAWQLMKKAATSKVCVPRHSVIIYPGFVLFCGVVVYDSLASIATYRINLSLLFFVTFHACQIIETRLSNYL